MYAQNVSIVNNNNLQKIMLVTILWSFGVMALVYTLILGNMVFNIVERRSLETESRALLSSTGGLELTYLSLSSKIDPSFGYSLGFQETTNKQFTTRKALGSLGTIKLVQNDL
ncbi:MAG: hypothetical protein Q8O46_03850 [bacterium]|nr:hypothetical protein [bacterium]